MEDKDYGIYGDNEYCDEACQQYLDEMEKNTGVKKKLCWLKEAERKTSE